MSGIKFRSRGRVGHVLGKTGKYEGKREIKMRCLPEQSQMCSERSQTAQFFQIFGIHNRNPFPLFHWHFVDVGEFYSIYNIGINTLMSDHTPENLPYERSQMSSERSQAPQFFQIFGIHNRSPFLPFHWNFVDVG